MKVLLILVSLGVIAAGWPVPGHEHEHEHHEHKHATSYQNFNLESYHPEPVYKKHHEDLHELKLSEHEGLSSGHGDLGSSLGSYATHEGLSEGLSEGFGHEYHRSALVDGGDESFAHLGAAAVSEDGESGYSGHSFSER